MQVSDEQRKLVSFQQEDGSSQEDVPTLRSGAAVDDADGTETVSEGITEAQIRAIAKAEATRVAQSLSDKSEHRLTKRMNELEDRRAKMAADGHVISDESFDQLKEQETLRALADDDAQADPSGVGSQEDERVSAVVNRRAVQIMQEVGEDQGVDNLTIEESDPEAKLLKFDSPENFLISMKEAAETKAERLSGGEPAVEEVLDESLMARVPTISGKSRRSNPIANMTDPSDLYDLAFSKKSKPKR